MAGIVSIVVLLILAVSAGLLHVPVVRTFALKKSRQYLVENQHVDVMTRGQDVVEAAIADVVGPAVASDHPDGASDEAVADAREVACIGAVEALELST